VKKYQLTIGSVLVGPNGTLINLAKTQFMRR
jgi:hypothetical protein